MRVGLLRLIGATTAAYGIAVAARPGLLARPSGLTDRDGRVAEDTEISLRPLAWRDAAGGLALLLAPEGPALGTAAAVRIASDLGDAVLLGRALRGRFRRFGAVATAGGWAALTLAAVLAPPRGTAGAGAAGAAGGPAAARSRWPAVRAARR
ncbi:hypothetical protein [Streptomyces aidingensis]|uniref:DUF4267 domain-containing protein n=1 Tax=Streptomyces aidingensis TaxID=910347 RepID=A0A1I1JH58_9ACTN|nr:hypothetical protein [Streptomyces aidingensis]SFC47959.1 hypothetical protein SAMN05421773_103423 [Streptomyces aidingensis]